MPVALTVFLRVLDLLSYLRSSTFPSICDCSSLLVKDLGLLVSSKTKEGISASSVKSQEWRRADWENLDGGHKRGPKPRRGKVP